MSNSSFQEEKFKDSATVRDCGELVCVKSCNQFAEGGLKAERLEELEKVLVINSVKGFFLIQKEQPGGVGKF